ncbi:MAG TPA: DUF1573 domain-containing protein [Desulfobacteraceae bacterium]|nr:DUF1573 domain-containing protein [Deltaproteobacteria bacterium]MBW2355390.1 DUF1573 domain-containing protein [Deltaproteobacteria bacterium]HDI59447.1 DUF1573 domain-containing protein [Desulfobacteraceae bacterium]
MKRLIVALLAGLTIAGAAPAMAAGKLSLDTTAVAFGTMKEGLVAEKVITLSNTGDAPLRIANVTTS